jgi:pectinesterase inhibitor-like protein
MAAFAFLFLVAGFLTQLLILFHPAAGNNNNPHQPRLVQSTCNSTTFYDLCVAAIAADPSSSTTDNVLGLCTIIVSAAAANASATSSTLLASTSASLRACAAKYGDAREALLAARVSLAQEAYDYALVHVTAAAEYPAVCRRMFRLNKQYPAELNKKEEGLRRLCTIAMDIISSSLLQTT